MNTCTTSLLRFLLLLNLALVAAVIAAGSAGPVDAPKRSFEIPAGEALTTLKQFAAQSGAQLLYSAVEVEGVRTSATKGQFSPREALDHLLHGTSLVAELDERTGALTVRVGSRSAPSPVDHSVLPAGSFGILGGQISSAATRNTLEGVVVELPGLRRQVLTDRNGRFEFSSVPSGNIEVAISHLGLATVRRIMTIVGGRRVTLDVALQAEDAIRLEKFVVATEREGNAAAITRQRTADNVKSVVAMDALGILSNDNAGELLVQLAGISGEPDDVGNVFNVRIRGISSEQNSVTVDGNKMASSGGMARNFRLGAISGALFDEVEVTKASTPEMDADSLGGGVNFKTRSALASRDRRRGTYRLGVRWLPPFTDQTIYRQNHRTAPLFNFSYTQIFDVGRGARNLGVTLTASGSQNNRGAKVTQQERLDTTVGPSYIRTFVANDVYNAGRQESYGVRFDYKISDRSSVYFTTKVSDASQRTLAELKTTASVNTPRVLTFDAAGQPTGTGQIYPDFTDSVTRVRAQATNFLEINTFTRAFFDLQRLFNAGGQYQTGWLKLDYDGGITSSSVIQFDGPYPKKDYPGGGLFTMRVTNIGWRYDETASVTDPVFVQTEGASIFDPRSYGTGVLTRRDNKRFTRIATGSGSATLNLPWEFLTQLKVGGRYRVNHIDITGGNRTFNYAGPDGIRGGAGAADDLPGLIDPSASLNNSYWQSRGRIPFPTVGALAVDIRDNPRRWVEDHYASEAQKYIGTSSLDETLRAAFGQSRVQWGKLRILSGVRLEQVDVDAFAFIKGVKKPATPITDQRELARFDYNNPRTGSGSTRSFFPSAHLTYQFTKGLQARASWSNGIGRPPTANLLPVETVNEAAEALTINNQAIKPQFTKNYDATLEYYFEPVGMVSVGYFQKNIRDYIVSNVLGLVPSGADNGYNGDYAGYTLRSQSNAGGARIDGWEFSYQQQLTFLPGLLRGLGVFANYTRLRTEGNFGGATVRRTGQVAGFVPQSGNAGFTYKYRRAGIRVSANYTGENLTDFSTTEALLRYRTARTLVNVGTTLTLRPGTEFFFNVENLFDEPQQWYRYKPSRRQGTNFNGVGVFFGVDGRF